MLPRLGLVICVLTLSAPIGCAFYRGPEVEVVSASRRETTPEAAGLEVVLELQNPNDEPLKLLEIHYDVRLDGGATFSGRRAARSTLPPRARQVVVLPAVARGDGAAALGESAAIHGTLRYVTPGKIAEVLFDVGLRRPKTGFKGNVRLSEAVSSP